MIDFKDIYDYEFCAALIKRLNIKVTVSGQENIPKEGGFIFAGNHPLGGMDAMALVTVIEPYRKDVKFIVNDILLNIFECRTPNQSLHCCEFNF